ncbi:hypothetical protein QP71_00115, partial [Staphylococcus aureus]
VVLVDIAHAAAQCLGRRGLLLEALGGAAMDHCRGAQIALLEADLARHQLAARIAVARLQRLDDHRQPVEQRARGQPLIAAEQAAAGLDPRRIGDGDDRAAAIGGGDLHPVAMARSDHALDLGPRRHRGR